MKTASQLFDNYKTSVYKQQVTAKNEWGELIGTIVKKINEGRKETKYKPVEKGKILRDVKGFDTDSLRDFVTECEKSTNFGWCFYGKLKKIKESRKK